MSCLRFSDGLETGGLLVGRLSVVFRDLRGTEPVSLVDAVKDVEELTTVKDAKEAAEFLTTQALAQAKGKAAKPHLMIFASLYSAEEETDPPLYKVMNACCYMQDRKQVKPFAKYMHGLIHAMASLPPSLEVRVVFRGVPGKDLLAEYKEGTTKVWWGCSSCTTSLNLLEEQPQFCGKKGLRTIFVVQLHPRTRARAIEEYSLVPAEKEILLPFGTTIKVLSAAAPSSDGLCLVHVEEQDVQDSGLASLWEEAVAMQGQPAAKEPAQEAEAEAKKKADDMAKTKAEEKAKEEADKKAKKEAEAKAQQEAEDMAKKKANRKFTRNFNNGVTYEQDGKEVTISAGLKSTDSDLMACITEELPKGIDKLTFSCNYGHKFTDTLLQELAKKLPSDLNYLHLNFYSNQRFTDDAIRELAKKLPSDLNYLYLNFGLNTKFTDDAIRELAKNIPSGLTELLLNFYQNKNFTDAAIRELAKNMPSDLKDLRLYFDDNERFTDAAIKELAKSIPSGLTKLALFFTENKNFTDAAIRELIGAIPVGCRERILWLKNKKW